MTSINQIRQLGGLKALLLLALFGFAFAATAQSPCPPQSNTRTSNPPFPGCQDPEGEPFRVLLVIDESGSISPSEANTFRNAVEAFATTLAGSFQTAGRVEMGIVEFNDNASVGLPMTDVSANNFVNSVNNYLSNNYNPSGWTNYVAALNAAREIPNLDMVFFMSDGEPTRGGTNQEDYRPIANQMKCNGTFIFGLAIGTGGSSQFVNNIQQISGPCVLGSPGCGTLMQGGEFLQETFDILPVSLVILANELIDTEAPEIDCPNNQFKGNDPNECGARINFVPEVDDNCGIASSGCTPASGSLFPVGATQVTCTAVDNVGNESECQFMIIVSDVQAPSILCPQKAVVDCEASIDPSETGEPAVSDNCLVEDVSFEDAPAVGDCDWQCQFQRTWTVKDNHGNTSSCVQNIEINVAGLIEDALQGEPLVMGNNNFTLTIKKQDAHCISEEWFPYDGNSPEDLNHGNQEVDADCKPGNNKIVQDGPFAGSLESAFLAEAIELALYIRLDPSFGDIIIKDLAADRNCELQGIVKQAMAERENSDMNEFMRNVNIALSNNGPWAPSSHRAIVVELLQCINGATNLCDSQD
jgi:hypothetical protein